MIFYYQALDKNGENVADYIDATSEETARRKIKGLGYYPVKIEKHDVKKEDGAGKDSKLKESLERFIDSIKIKFLSKQVGLFSRQLSTLLQAGLALPTAINDIIDQIDDKLFRNIITDVKEKIEEGSTFSNAIARHNNVFSEMYINMIRVGENLGSLDHVVERLAEMEEKKSALKNKIQSALYYPGFMLFFASAIVIFLLATVIPTITEMFDEKSQELPLPTKIVIGVSDFLETYWFMIPIIVISAIYIFKKYSHTEEGRQKIDEIKLKIPLISKLYKKIIVFRFTQNLGILLSNKVDIIKSFEIVEKIVENVVIEKFISDASKLIKEGGSVTKSLQKFEFLPKMVIGMMSAGEASDNLDTMLLNIGKVYETEVELTISSLTSLLEPLIIIVMGGVIGTIVVSIMLPMMQMNLLIQ
jgi:general secretion pathway protein F